MIVPDLSSLQLLQLSPAGKLPEPSELQWALSFESGLVGQVMEW